MATEKKYANIIIQDLQTLAYQNDELLKEKDRIIEHQDRIIQEKSHIIEGNENVIQEKDHIIEEKNHIIEENQNVIQEKDQIIEGQENIIREANEYCSKVDKKCFDLELQVEQLEKLLNEKQTISLDDKKFIWKKITQISNGLWKLSSLIIISSMVFFIKRK